MDTLEFGSTLKRSFSDWNYDVEPVDSNGRHKRYQSSISRKPASAKLDETVLRILCPVTKTGGIIGKGGSIIKSIREDTGAMIRIEDAMPGADVRVVTITARAVLAVQKAEDGISKVLSPEEANENDKGINEKKVENAGKKENEELKEFKTSPAQEALLRVYLRIVEIEGTQNIDQKDSLARTTAKLLVPASQVGCVLGKKGKIIEQMREETGAQIRILSSDQIPGFAASTDEVVQIMGELEAVKKAIYAISFRLQENPPKFQGHTGLEASPATPGGIQTGSSFGLHVEESAIGGLATYGSDRNARASDPFYYRGDEVSFRILCPKAKIGSIIGKGGSIVNNIREETGAKIRIDVSGPESDERVVFITAVEHMDETLSKAQAALMQVHSKIIDPGPDKDAIVTTKLVVPSDQVGCLIGKGGSIIAEMRKATRANIRIYGKDKLPPGATESDELVQIVGDIEVSHAALMRIAVQLRNNLFHGKYGEKFRAAVDYVGGSANHFEHQRSNEFVSPRRPFSSLSDVSPRGSSRINANLVPVPSPWHSQGRRGRSFSDHDLHSGHDNAEDLIRSNSSIVNFTKVEVVIPDRHIGSIIGHSGTNLANIRQISGAKVTLHERKPGAIGWTVEIYGTSDQTHAAQRLIQAFILNEQ